MKPVTLTIDLEDPSESYAPNSRARAMTEKILALCEETQRKATFFVVGALGQEWPDLIVRIAAQGHEIAYHTHAHLPLTEEVPERFQRETAIDKDKIEQLIGRPVTGFRAPCYSLTPETLWATDILKELGFDYSSSIMPTSLSRFGFADAPATFSSTATEPFVWPSGLWEFPLPVGRIGALRVPYLGGIYLYALPSMVSDFFLSRAGENETLWTYAHPYDFDKDEPYARLANTPHWVSMILYAARRCAEAKIRHVIGRSKPAPPLGDIAADRIREIVALRSGEAP